MNRSLPWVEKTMIGLALLLAIASVLIPLLMAILWSLVSMETPWSYPDLFPQKLAWDRWIAVWNFSAIKEALKNSYSLAPVVGLFCVLLSLPTAYALGRFQFKLKPTVEILCLLPMMIPGMVVALFLTQAFLRFGIHNKFIGITLGHIMVNLPYSIRILSAAFNKVPQEQIDAARDLGARPFKVLWTAYIPIVRPATFATFIYVFLRSIEEFNIAYILGAPNFVTVPTILFSFLGYNFVRPNAAVVSLILMIPNIFLMIAMEKFFNADRALGSGVKG